MKRAVLVLSWALLVLTIDGTFVSYSPAHAEKSASGIEKVLARFRNVPAFSARFREEKHMTLLSVPLVSEGELHYRRPGQLVRRTTSPEKALLIIDRGTLHLRDGSGARTLSEKTHPAVGAVSNTFLQVLAGDLNGLRKGATLEETMLEDGSFKVRVISKDAALVRIIREITFEGRGETLTRMTLVDGNGDTTITTFSAVRVRKDIPAAEWARLTRFEG